MALIRRRLLALADYIEKMEAATVTEDLYQIAGAGSKGGFSMKYWGMQLKYLDPDKGVVHCGTVCCIGGTAAWMAPEGVSAYRWLSSASPNSEDYYIDIDTLDYLFYPGTNKEEGVILGEADNENPGWDATPRQAAWVIRQFATNGGYALWDDMPTDEELANGTATDAITD